MRFATNSVTTGNRSVVLDICTFLRGVYAEYQRLASVLTGPGMGGGAYKELPKKMEVWMQSLVKIETRSYRRCRRCPCRCRRIRADYFGV